MALKGPNRIAPGNARGADLRNRESHPVRVKQDPSGPFRAEMSGAATVPRALPWAFLFDPVGVGEGKITTALRNGIGRRSLLWQAQLFSAPPQPWRAEKLVLLVSNGERGGIAFRCAGAMVSWP